MAFWTTHIAKTLVPSPPAAELKPEEDSGLRPNSGLLSVPKLSVSRNSSVHSGSSREEVVSANLRVFRLLPPTQSGWSVRWVTGRLQRWLDVSRPLSTTIYTRSLIGCGYGYPLWPCTPQNNLPTRVLNEGIVIGDVGTLRDGCFEFLFNVCKSRVDDSSDSMYQVQLGHPFFRGHSTERDDVFERGKAILSDSYQISQEGSDYVYHSSAKHGGLLNLPGRVIRRDVDDEEQMLSFAMEHAADWYRIASAMNGASINGSLFLVAGHDKTSFASAAFHSLPPGGSEIRLKLGKPESPGGTNELQATHSLSDDGRYGVQTSCVGSTARKEEKSSRCIFLRGFKIKLGDKESEVLLTQIKLKQTFTPLEMKEILATPSLVPARARGVS